MDQQHFIKVTNTTQVKKKNHHFKYHPSKEKTFFFLILLNNVSYSIISVQNIACQFIHNFVTELIVNFLFIVSIYIRSYSHDEWQHMLIQGSRHKI